jgi:pyridoxal phosphate enzyme (YggS family)
VTQITKNLETLRARIAQATAAAGRNENEVSLLAVSKRHTPESIALARDAGLNCMAENYLQEALEKIALLGNDIEWHYIGRIQSNKSKAIAMNFQWAQTVHTMKIARRLNDQRPQEMSALNVCVQVNTDHGKGNDKGHDQGHNKGHGGAEPGEVAALCAFIEEQPRLRLRGLMCIPMPADSTERQHEPFRALKELYEQLINAGHDLDTLSMGMSNDLEVAIAEGSTMVRIGTALFGPRPS